jgi:hypothetical protein
MEDPEILRDVKHWPFKVKEKSGKPVINVKYKGDDKEFVSSVDGNNVLIANMLIVISIDPRGNFRDGSW